MSEEEATRRAEDALRRAFATPPQPHQPIGKKGKSHESPEPEPEPKRKSVDEPTSKKGESPRGPGEKRQTSKPKRN